jgi:hypothetical protein
MVRRTFKYHAGTTPCRDLTVAATGAADARHVPSRAACAVCTPSRTKRPRQATGVSQLPGRQRVVTARPPARRRAFGPSPQGPPWRATVCLTVDFDAVSSARRA